MNLWERFYTNKENEIGNNFLFSMPGFAAGKPHNHRCHLKSLHKKEYRKLEQDYEKLQKKTKTLSKIINFLSQRSLEGDRNVVVK